MRARRDPPGLSHEERHARDVVGVERPFDLAAMVADR